MHLFFYKNNLRENVIAKHSILSHLNHDNLISLEMYHIF